MDKKIEIKRLGFAIYYLLFTTSCLYAAFEDTGVGARAVGFNNAFVGLADDVYAIYYNPSGLVRVKQKEFALDYSRLFLGLDDDSVLSNSFVGYTQSFKNLGAFGLGWTNFTLSNYYSEDTFIMSYGREIPWRLFGLNFNTGINLKYLLLSYGKTLYTENAVNLNTSQTKGSRDPVFRNGYSKGSLGVDFGLLAAIDNNNSFGVVFNNLNQPDIGLLSRDKVPSSIKFGYSYRSKELNIVSDLSLKNNDYTLVSGAEKWFLRNTLALRGGLGIGSRQYADISLGASFVFKGVYQIDYAMKYPLSGVAGTYGSHRITLTLKFGPAITETAQVEATVEELKAELERYKELVETERKKSREVSDHRKELTDEEVMRIKEESDRTIKELRQKLAQTEEKLRQKEEEVKMREMKILWDSGSQLYNEGKYEEASVKFKKILELLPKHEPSLKMLKLIEERLKADRRAKAERYFAEGLRNYSAGRLTDAVKNFEAALELDPHNEEVRKALSRIKKELEAR